jgi:hypothetical protein
MNDFLELALPLGAYQTVRVMPMDLGDQFTEPGNAPRSVVVGVTGTRDFKTESIVLVLSERAQRDLILALDANLNPGSERAGRTLDYIDAMPYGSVTR